MGHLVGPGSISIGIVRAISFPNNLALTPIKMEELLVSRFH